MFLGSNPFFGYAHRNPQATGAEMRQWYTPERIMAVLDEAAELGINAVWTPCRADWIRLWNEYKDRGGKLEHWIAQPDRLPMNEEIKGAISNGSTAVCIQGIKVDNEIKAGRWDVVRGWLELIKSAGRIAPADALPYVFRRLKQKNGICVGVFPKKNPNEIRENVILTKQCQLRHPNQEDNQL